MKEQIIRIFGQDVYQLITRYTDIETSNTAILSTSTVFNIEHFAHAKNHSIVNLRRINDIRFINKFFEAINSRLVPNGIFIGCVEPIDARKQRLLNKYPFLLNYIYYFFDFIIKRVFPKFRLTKRIYFFLTRGQNRSVSRAETLGRLYSCGFEVIEELKVNNIFYFVARKTGEPAYDPDPSYGPIVRLRRLGKNGKIIKVYKFRTMHPFSEYLQDYMFHKNKLREGGKFNDDFRVSTIGRIMRKFWIDEIPMIINLFRMEIKIVGVRPLSMQYFNLYPKDMQERRLKYKPGLIPPFYADMPKTFDQIIESEKRYLDRYDQYPLRTDIVYFFRACWNILFRKARSN